MKNYTVNISKDPEETHRSTAKELLQVANLAISERGRFSVALSGGASPRRLYQILAEQRNRSEIDWSKAEIFWSDERAVGPEDNQSNYRMAKEALLDPLNISEKQIHRIPGEMPDLDLVAQDYHNEVGQVLGWSSLGEPPRIDLVLLGLGTDGHTASLFPATPALLETRRWVVRNPVLKLEADRITMTPMLINRAHDVFFLVIGAEKAEILAEVLEGPIDTQRLPAQLIHPADGKICWFVDEAAGRKLKSK